MAVQTTQGAFTIDGVHTELLVSEYSNRLLLVVTQIGKLGTMYHAAGAGPAGVGGEGGRGGGLLSSSIPSMAYGYLPSPPEVRTLVGRHDDEMLTAAARRLVQIVQSRGVSKPILVSLGLKPKLEVGTLRGIVRTMGDFCCESLGLAPPPQSMAGMSME